MLPRPGRDEATKADVYPGAGGFRYTLRNSEGRVIWDSDRPFRSRHAARSDILRSWPKCKVSFEIA